MKMTKQYPDICKTCNGKGQIADVPNTTCPYRTCPVCNGAGTIIITETSEYDDWLEQIRNIIPKSIF